MTDSKWWQRNYVYHRTARNKSCVIVILSGRVLNTFSTSAYSDVNYKNWCYMQDKKKMKKTKCIVSIQNREAHGNTAAVMV